MNKKKILIVTRHFVSNYGSFLQTFATQEVIKKIGCEPEILDYFDSSEKSINSAKIWKKNFNKSFIKSVCYFLVCSLPNISTERAFLRYRKKHFKMTERFSSDRIILKKTYDCIVSGSDQLWGPIGDKGFCPIYFSENLKSSRYISYASSFGMVDLDNSNIDYKNMLKKYYKIGVREQSAVNFIENLGLNATLNLDPTLLLDRSFYDEFLPKPKHLQEKYILLYQLHNNKNLNEIALSLAQKTNYKIFRISPNKAHKFKKPGKFLYINNPFEFISYIDNAEYVLTDSYHCCIFSLLYSKKFIVVSPGKTSTRIENLLDIFNLKHRYQVSLDFNELDKDLNIDEINETLIRLRESSMKFLKDSIFL